MKKLILTAFDATGLAVAKTEYVGDWFDTDEHIKWFHLIAAKALAVRIQSDLYLNVEDQIRQSTRGTLERSLHN